ncbi:unnamed protein product [Linum trigynum]|uniref:Serpin domain-containing protein n=1 Tax=Linum trigynum TaxID=586398 RepID=A0AAV2DZB8_9ROSI
MPNYLYTLKENFKIATTKQPFQTHPFLPNGDPFPLPSGAGKTPPLQLLPSPPANPSPSATPSRRQTLPPPSHSASAQVHSASALPRSIPLSPQAAAVVDARRCRRLAPVAGLPLSHLLTRLRAVPVAGLLSLNRAPLLEKMVNPPRLTVGATASDLRLANDLRFAHGATTSDLRLANGETANEMRFPFFFKKVYLVGVATHDSDVLPTISAPE